MTDARSTQSGTVIRGMYDAIAQGDMSAIAAAMAPDIVWNEAESFPYADGNPYVGADAIVKGLFARLGAEWESWNIDKQKFVECGDQVVVLGRYSGKYKATNKTIDAQFAHVWTVNDGKITSFQQYVDTAQVAQAVGAM